MCFLIFLFVSSKIDQSDFSIVPTDRTAQLSLGAGVDVRCRTIANMFKKSNKTTFTIYLPKLSENKLLRNRAFRHTANGKPSGECVLI